MNNEELTMKERIKLWISANTVDLIVGIIVFGLYFGQIFLYLGLMCDWHFIDATINLWHSKNGKAYIQLFLICFVVPSLIYGFVFLVESKTRNSNKYIVRKINKVFTYIIEH